MQQIKVQQDHDLVDEEVGMLSDAVVKLKGMVKQIGDEAEETGAKDWISRFLRLLYSSCSVVS